MSVRTTKQYVENYDATRMRKKREAVNQSMTEEEKRAHRKKLADQKKAYRASKKPEPEKKPIVVSVKNDACTKEKQDAIQEFAKSLDKVEAKTKQQIPKTLKEKVEKVVTKRTSISNDDEIIKMVRDKAVQAKDTKAPNEKTIKQYLTSLHQIQNEMTDTVNPILDFSNFNDVEGVIDAVVNMQTKQHKTISQNTTIKHLTALSAVLKYVNGYEVVASEYSEVVSAMREQEVQQREKNLPDVNNPLVEWSKIVKQNENPGLFRNEKERVLYAVYTLLPVRRIEDYRTMTIQYANTALPEDGNYLILNAGGVPLKLVYGRYKTDKHFGIQEQNTNPYLKSILEPYIKTLSVGSLLFPSSRNNAFTQGGFSKYVSDLFERVLNVKTTVNSLRHSAISYFLKSNTSVEQKRKFASAMGHTMQTQALYNKIEAEPEQIARTKKGKGKYVVNLNEVYPWM